MTHYNIYTVRNDKKYFKYQEFTSIDEAISLTSLQATGLTRARSRSHTRAAGRAGNPDPAELCSCYQCSSLKPRGGESEQGHTYTHIVVQSVDE